MLNYIDIRSQKPADEIIADICIIGGGAAGVTIAAHLESTGSRIVILESGGKVLEGETQLLYSAKQTGERYFDLTTCRLRYFSGTTNHWGGFCRENDPIDYEGRPELNIPSWPVGKDELSPFIHKAQALLGLNREEFDPAIKAAKHGVNPNQLLERASPDFLTKIFQIAKKRKIHEILEEKLSQTKNIDVYLHANATHIELAKNGESVDHIIVKSLEGTEFKAKAKFYIVAAHAIESARLLLVSNNVLPTGIGNTSGWVGKNFMEHIHIESGIFYPGGNFPSLYNFHWAEKRGINANLSFSASAMKREGIMQYYCRFSPIYGYEGLYNHFSSLRNRFWKPADLQAMKSMAAIFSDIPDSLRFMGGIAFGRDKLTPTAFHLDQRIEQSPNSNSYIKLTDEKDILGVRKIAFNWDFSELDVKTFNKGQELVMREFTRLGLGRFDAPNITSDLVRQKARGHYHHIGTLRMASSASAGVVDKNCKLFGIDNLYACGSGIFPTAGYSGPTMMIISFSIRLAEHLSGRLK